MADKRYKLRMTPLGTPALVTQDDPEGRGAETSGIMITAPDSPHESIPHELMHAGVSALRGLPGVVPLELLSKALSKHAYGEDAIFQDPFERVAYGYQEAETGKSDPEFQNSSSPERVAAYPSGKTNILARNLMDFFGGGAEAVGRRLGR